LNPGQIFHWMQLLEIKLDLKGLLALPCFFFKLMFSYFF